MIRLTRPDNPRIRLICFPFAGGSPDAFRAWADGVNDDVELIAVRLPGHGSRISEKPYQDWERLVEDAFTALSPYLTEPYAFYGHSFGGRLAYELTHRAGEFVRQHRGLFISGCRSPDAPQARPYMYDLPTDEFRALLRRMGGTPPEILDNDALMRTLMPVIRGEFRLAELWHDWHACGVDVFITAMYGRDDTIESLASVRGWHAFSRKGCELIEMPGGHFFLETHRPDLLRGINERLGVVRG